MRRLAVRTNCPTVAEKPERKALNGYTSNKKVSEVCSELVWISLRTLGINYSSSHCGLLPSLAVPRDCHCKSARAAGKGHAIWNCCFFLPNAPDIPTGIKSRV